MRKRHVMIIASGVHTVLWVAFLPISIVKRLMFRAEPGMEGWELYFDKGMYDFFIKVAVAGIFTSALLLFSLRSVSTAAVMKGKGLGKLVLAFSVLSNILFYLSAVLLFLIKTDAIIIVPIAWFLCAACSCVILIVVKLKKS